MKKMKFFACLYVALFTLGSISTTVCAIEFLPQYGLLPLNDTVDDVFYNDGTDQKFDGSGNYTDYIDIVKANITGFDIIVEFQAAGPRSGSNYTFSLYLLIYGSILPFIEISYSFSGGAYLMRLINDIHVNDGWYWSGISWIDTINSLPSSDVGVYLTLHTVWNATFDLGYNLSELYVHVVAGSEEYIEYGYYDFLPEGLPKDDIPSFQMLTVLFSIVTLVSLISIYKYKKP